MENRFCQQGDNSVQIESINCEVVQQLNEPTPLTCVLNTSLPPPPPQPPSSSSSSTRSSSIKVKTKCHQSTKDRLRSVLTKTSSKKVTKAKNKLSVPSKEKLSNTINQSTFDRLIEDNFITISLQDELLALKSDLRQFEKNKFTELTRFTSLYNEKITSSKSHPQSKLLMADLEKQTTKWINSLKHISSFKNIGINDQMLCIKRHFVDMCIIKSLVAIDSETKTVQKNGLNMGMRKCPLMSDPKFLTLLSTENNFLRCDPIINLLIVLIYLFDANTPNLESTYGVRKEYIITVHLIQKYLEHSGLTTDQANSEISRFIKDLISFFTSFNAKKRVLNTETSVALITSSSQLLTEIMELGEQ